MSTRRVFRWDPWSMAQAAPNRPAVVDDDATYTYATLTARADRLGRGLRHLGLPDGAVVSTTLPVSARLFALVLAALKYGYGLLPVPGGIPGTGPLLARAGVRLHVGASGTGTVPEVSEETVLCAAARYPCRTAPATEPRAGFLVLAAPDPAGVPRPVVRCRPWYPYRGVVVQDRYGAGPHRGAHVMADPVPQLGPLGRALHALQAGSPVIVQRDWSAPAFLALLTRYRADSAFIDAARAIDLAATARRPIHRPRVVFHGGGACAPAVKRALIDRLGPVLHEFYEVPEGTVTEITTPEWLRRPGSVGRPVPGVRVRICRPGRPPRESRPIGTPPSGPGPGGPGDVGPRAVGEVLVRHRRGDGAPGEVELHTGDLGYLDARGYLYLVGRAA